MDSRNNGCPQGEYSRKHPPQSGATYNFCSLNGLYPPPTGEQHSELDKELGWSDGHKQNIAPNFHNSQVNTRECRLQGQDSHRAFSNCKTGYWRGVPLSGGGATTQRTLDGKFLDSGNGDCSAVVAEYDEQKEREIAEAIFDWWISKKSYKQWYAEKYLQLKINFNKEE